MDFKTVVLSFGVHGFLAGGDVTPPTLIKPMALEHSNLMTGKELKKRIVELLRPPDFEKNLGDICRFPARRAVNPLFSLFHNPDEDIRWRAITAMGAVVSNLADRDTESARVVMRRLIWNLNDESGGIGWGSPEALGEIMARNEKLAREYAFTLVSYLNPEGNHIEHEGLQRGVLWGSGRLSHERPSLISDAAPFLAPHLKSADPILRGLAVWAIGPLRWENAAPLLGQLANDDAIVGLFNGNAIVRVRIGRLAEEAVSQY